MEFLERDLGNLGVNYVLCIFNRTVRYIIRVQDYLDSETFCRNDVIVSLRFG